MMRALRKNRSCARAAAFVAGGGVVLGAALCARVAQADVVPHTSEGELPSSNGRGAIAWSASTWRINQFLEHAYQNPTSSSQSRQFVYDSYPGVRIGATGTWLSSVQPTTIEYLPGTGIVHAARTLSGYSFDEYDFAPMGLTENASVMLVTVTNKSATAPLDVYSLFNYQLGSAVSGSAMPGSDSETISYDASNGAYYESGPSGVAFAYFPLGTATHHGCTPNNPFGLLSSGANLLDDPGTGGPTSGAVAGFQTSLGTLAVGSSQTLGWVTVLDPSANAQAAVGRVAAWVNGRSAAQLLSDEVAGWAAWQKAPPAGASAFESRVAAQSQAILRMGQVTEAAPAGGQILASIAPGEWNITWVRDMAYATVALVKSGHYAEAKAALAFQMGATANAYESYVGKPYKISVCRYFGNGTEQSDSNADGPNIEFDGFGLFLWSLDEYVRASGDTASLQAWWPMVKSMVADVLVSLQDVGTGLIAQDSSIWEVHWNGQQKHFAYTTITAANGLCSAARLATAAGDTADVATYGAAGAAARDGVLRSLRAPDGTIAQSFEGLAAGSGWLDAAAVEAVTFGLFDPTRGTTQATLRSIEAGLVPPSGRGFMRDQSGGTYDSQEWVFVDLRMERAMELHGESANQTALFGWNTDQAIDNFGELSELHAAVTADYTGASPMVGFGAGAYLIALADRGTAVTPTCGSFAAEPALPVDAGVDAAAGAVDGGSTAAGDGGAAPVGSDAGEPIAHADASVPSPPGSQDDAGGDAGGSSSSPAGGGCGCVMAGSDSSGSRAPWLLVAGALGLVARMRRRSKRGTR
jgi:MYXO-CTERM domain-containing protein